MISAEATSAPSTSARQSNFQIPLKARFSVHFQEDLIAGLDGAPEARMVDGDEIKACVGIGHHLDRLEREDAAGLRECLDDHHAGHHGPVGKMAGKERLVERHVLDGVDELTRLAVDHPVNEQERIPMRQLVHDRFDIQTVPLRHHRSFSPKRRKCATIRRQARVGTVGIPLE